MSPSVLVHYRAKCDGIAARDTREDQDQGDTPGHGCTAWSKGHRLQRVHLASAPRVLWGTGGHWGTWQPRNVPGTGNPFPHTDCRHPGTEAVRGSAGHWQGKISQSRICARPEPTAERESPTVSRKWGPGATDIRCHGVWGLHGVPGPAAKPLQFLGKCLAFT